MKNKREINIIDRILEIFHSAANWTQKVNARDEYGEPVYPPNDRAVCWCLEGAIYKAIWEQKLSKRKWNNSYWKIVGAICKVQGLKFNIRHQDEHIGYNDAADTTFEMVIETLNKAKAYLQGEYKVWEPTQ